MGRNNALRMRKLEYFIEATMALEKIEKQFVDLRDKTKAFAKEMKKYRTEVKMKVKKGVLTDEDEHAYTEKRKNCEIEMRKATEDFKEQLLKLGELVSLSPCADRRLYKFTDQIPSQDVIDAWMRLSDMEVDRRINRIKKALVKFVNNKIKLQKKVLRKKYNGRI